MQLEGVGTVSVCGLLRHVLGQVDNHDRIERAFLHRNCPSLVNYQVAFSDVPKRSRDVVIMDKKRCHRLKHLDADAAANAELL